MPTPQPFTIGSNCTPGVQRDGTVFDSPAYIDAKWCRWNAKGRPRKMAGYKATTQGLPEIARGIESYETGGVNYIHVGGQSFITQVQTNATTGVFSTAGDRTPVGFAGNPNNLWQFDELQNTAGGFMALIAHPGQNLSDITNSVETPIYYGNVAATTALVASGMLNVSGGVVAIAPYLVAYSNNGRIDVSSQYNVTSAPNSANVTSKKIVKGMAIRNGSGGPAALLWSLDSLILMTFASGLVAGIPFNFNTISDDISVLSSQGFVEADGLYYWAAVDHFAVFNGVVQELKNSMSVDFFFDNLNYTWRQKVFAFKVPRWGEIWWCFPRGTATECNWAVIYNTRLGVWYDTPLPDGGRSAAVLARVFQKPFITDVDLTGTGYTLWQHETGTDKIIGTQNLAIDSFFQTAEMSPVISPQAATDKAFRVSIVEPDFVQSGPITMQVGYRANARATPNFTPPVTISQTAATSADQLSYAKQDARLLSFKFESNIAGGDYTMGRPLAHIEPTDGRQTQ